MRHRRTFTLASPLNPSNSPLRYGSGRSNCLRKSMFADLFRPFPCWTESYHTVHKAHKMQTYRVLSSCEAQGIDMDGKEIMRNNYLIDCGEDQECVVGGVVALGKFDALHIGHRELAIQASKAGIPFLLSFAGIAEVLGWPSRPPIVANCDRKRVLSTWAPYCSNIVPLEYQIDFSSVRHLSPRQFVEKLSKDLRVSGVVAGENYRFGYKACGNVQDLISLCHEYGMSAHIVPSVMDKTRRRSTNGASFDGGGNDVGQVSSTRVRRALAARDLEHVAGLLGRKHRLVLMLANGGYHLSQNAVIAPSSCMLNLPPGDGEFSNCTVVLDGETGAGFCNVVIDSGFIRIELDQNSLLGFDLARDGQHPMGIEFG
ncbi:hypothetical protein HPP92_017206 [Vanilla planifolia]|uniref:FAD synthase n=1 Tax=Vanilla planifolia TaxID=51239 RepID=A0A835QAQ0_VANPL|nr:hypothetical protein HPP92_017206 [Vanilla planifolia]